jgi:dTDP-4-amino-4,6-dideoxygalactose transaminase
MLAGFLCAQFEKRDEIQARRKFIWMYYDEYLRGWAEAHNVRLPVVPAHCEQAYHMFYLIMPSLETRQALIARLKSLGILSVFHYLPLNLSEMGLKLGGKPGDCPITEDLTDRLLRLPFYFQLSEAEQARVVKAIKEFDGK